MKKILVACTLTFLAFGVASELRASTITSLQGQSSIAPSNSNAGKFPTITSGNAIITNRNRNAATSNGPYIVRVEPDAAPSGAIIELWIQYDIVPDSPPSMRVEIRGVPAEIVQIEKSKIAVIVPRFEAPLPPPGGSVTANIRLFSENNPSTVFKNFRVLSSVVSKNPSTQITAIEEIPPSHETVNIRLSTGIPVVLWGLVKFYVDDRPVEKINRMTPRLFTITLPSDLPEKPSYAVFFTIGEEYQSYTFSFFPSWYKPSQTDTLPKELGSSNLSWVVIGAVVLLAALVTVTLVATFYYFRRRKRDAESTAKAGNQENVEMLRLPEEVPADLLDVCVAGECVLYAGAGLSAQSGLPTWRDFVHKLLEWALDNHFITADEAATYRAEIDTGHADPVADSVISRLKTARDQSLLNEYLKKVFLRKASPSRLHSQLVRIKFSAALTTNFDDLLERVYDTPFEQVYTPKNTESLLAALTRGDFFLLKLYGTLDQPDTVMVAPKQYEDAITGNRLFSEFMETLFFSRTLLFIGASLEGIETYLRGISLPKNVTRRHYALVAITGTSWRAQADLLERRYGIKVLPYTASDDYAELRDFLSRLTVNVAARSNNETGSKRTVSRLKRLELENIGPFDALDLEFDPEWQILLGDNGVGKSTILKAIAIALSGEKAAPYAGRFLRRDPDGSISKRGKIVLETDNKTRYVTEIERSKDDDAELISRTARPLEAEGWLAVGFPPLRTASWESPKGPEADLTKKSRPVAEDLLPLVKGDVDPRLDKLKQWIVNQDYKDSKSEPGNDGRGSPHRELVVKLFRVIGTVTEGMTLNYEGVEKGTNRILIKTDTGAEIPLEGLSQGTISLIGWVGILMQRLYEVFDQDEDPTKRYALILMDEIDAHMHPAWQRTLVNHLKSIFPNAQFIATTHSPLVVSGMPIEQVTRFGKAEDNKIVLLHVEPDMTLGYSDQVLTSTLFGLETTLDDTTEKRQKRYYELFEMENLNQQQEAELENLQQDLMLRIPPPSASYAEKHEEQMTEANMLKRLGEKLKEKSSGGGQLLLNRAENLRASLEGGKKDDSD